MDIGKWVAKRMIDLFESGQQQQVRQVRTQKKLLTK